MTRGSRGERKPFTTPWRRERPPEVPVTTEIAAAVKALRKRGQLIWLEGGVGNDGFSVSMSFNPVTFQSTPADFIELALKTVSLEFKPRDPTGWRWSEVVSQFVRASIDTVSIKLGAQQTDGETTNLTHRGQAVIEGELGLPLTGKLKGAFQQGRDQARGAQSSRTDIAEMLRTERDHWVEMTRSGTTFNLRLDSPPGGDLVRFNSEFDRLSVLFAPEPSILKPDHVSVTMRLHLKGELRHAYEIRDAGGCWDNLRSSRNRQVVAELMIAKFLRPMHGPVRLWPPKPEKGS